jgi:hypothetical protein
MITLLTIVLNIYGTIALVGGALYSAYLFWRKSVLFNRMLGNLLIAAGALMPAMAGSFVKAGLVDWLYMSELLGVVLMYAVLCWRPPQPVKAIALAAAMGTESCTGLVVIAGRRAHHGTFWGKLHILFSLDAKMRSF